MQSSITLFERALAVIPGGVNSPVRAFRSVGGAPFFTVSANGAELTTADGNTLIDYVCTWGPAIHGHNPPFIREAIAEALKHGTSFGTPNPYEVEMAEKIVRLIPSIEKVRMVNSGTEATMSCIRLARGATGRTKIVKFAGCYHGHVDALLVKAGSGALTFGHPDSAGIPASVAADTFVLPFNDTEALQTLFEKQGSEIACVILEPVPANCGLILPLPNFLNTVAAICKQSGTLLIFDEVMSGFRLSLAGAQGLFGIDPDLTALGKIIGGGLPVGAFGGKSRWMDQLAPLGPVYQAGTLSGNPLAMAAGIAALKELERTHPYGELNQMGAHIRDALLDTARIKGLPLQVPQIGSMFSLFFVDKTVENYEHALASHSHLFAKVFQKALANGIYLPPSAFETCFISTAHTTIDIDRTIDVLSNVLRTL
jgi:glutamate-1-semialdehyde 2,1-aminomutase